MELLLLLTMGAVAWLFDRSKKLERRITDLESATNSSETSAGEVTGLVPASSPAATQSSASVFKPQPAIAPETPTAAVSEPQLVPRPDASSDLPRFDHEERPEAQGYRWGPSFDFEEIFGRLLPIWGGGIALAIAGFFLVRWSIEVGLLNEYVRVALGFAFGVALLAAAEAAHRFEARLRDERVRQALAGAGLATLYASFYLAGSHYELMGAGLAFGGLAAVTALAIALSFRFGLPSAIMGLVGGFAAPALVGSPDPNLPLLATYLALVTGGLSVTGQRQGRTWLGLAALAGGLAWGAVIIVAGSGDNASILAVGSYLVLIGVLLPSIMGSGPLGQMGRIVAAGLATLQIAALVHHSGYSLLAWGCYLLLGAAIAVLGVRFVRLREAGGVAAALVAMLLAAWPEADPAWYAAIAAISALIFAAVPVAHTWRDQAGPIDWAQLALYPIAIVAASCFQFDIIVLENTNLLVALGAVFLAILPALAAWRVWPGPEETFHAGPFATFASALILMLLGGLLALPAWCAPLVSCALAFAAAALLGARMEAMPRIMRWTIAATGIILLLATMPWNEARMIFSAGEGGAEWLYALRWLASAAAVVSFLRFETAKGPRRCGEFLAAILGYGALAMVVPSHWIPFALALVVLALALRMEKRGTAFGTLLSIGGLWAAEALGIWVGAGLNALAGLPFLASDLPDLLDLLRTVAPLAAGLAGALVLSRTLFGRLRPFGWLVVAALCTVLLHSMFKQIFGIGDLVRFVDLGVAERTVWQALLAFGAVACVTLPQKFAGQKIAGFALAATALVHFAMFGLVLHNPLWDQQAVGSWPFANLLIPSYTVATGLVLWLRGMLAGTVERLRPVFDMFAMILIALLAVSELRQIYSGSLLLASPVGQQEDLLRSILAIAVALGFLGWGSVTQQRSWRIGSLVLMLGAVMKVFILDASGLEGLARIASFFALGVCLIGIGWFYSRQLTPARAVDGVGG